MQNGKRNPLIIDFLMPNGATFAKIAPIKLCIKEGRNRYILDLNDDFVKKSLRRAGRGRR